ncbi:MAG TPA: hypothetical protein VGJ13_15010 [Pseudonocardiaceae bacterium]
MLIRALLRAALLAGLVICGWLLGSAIALAAEDAPHQAHPTAALDGGNSPGTARGDLSATAPAGVDGLLSDALNGTATPQLPTAPPAVSGLVTRVAQPVAQLAQPVTRVAQPVTRDILTPVGPVPAIQPPLAHLTAPPAQATTEPAVPAAAAIQVPAAPLPQVTVPAPHTPDRAAADSSVNRFATMPALHRAAVPGERSGAPGAPTVPTGPLDTPTTSCPAGPGGANSAAPGAPAGVLSDTAIGADVGPRERSPQAGTGGLPRWLSQRPSTSPD